MSHFNPDDLKILRVKNRLAEGNKDLLINVKFKNKMVAEIQLAIKSDKSDFLKKSDKFSHFIYEMKRSTFGVID